MAPYCITMLLTPDYGERAKGKPEAPKAQTPYYCTSRSRASRSLTAPKGYKIPHLSTKGPLHWQAPGSQALRVQVGTSPVPSQRAQGHPCRRLGSLYSRNFEATATVKIDVPLVVRLSPMSGVGVPCPRPGLRYGLTRSHSYLGACKRRARSGRFIDRKNAPT